MFEAILDPEQPEFYCLRDTAAGSEARVAPHRGGMLTSFQVSGREVFYLDRETFDDPSKNVRGGMPLLFPICGPLKDGRFQVQGVDHKMAQHGFARIRRWRAMDSSTREGASVTVELEADRETERAFPWDFRLDYTYLLKGQTLRLEQSFKNQSETPMPLHFGLHPYFQVGGKDQLVFDIPATRYRDTQSWSEGEFQGRFDFSLDSIDWIFLDVSRRQAGFTDPSRGLRISLRFEQSYPYLVFWTIKGQQFVCLEPWSAQRFALNTGEGLIQLEPQGTLKTWVEIEATPI